MSNRLLISIVSFCDTELLPTIANALEQAQFPENITFSIFEQDLSSNEAAINAMVRAHGANLLYQYTSVEKTQGVVWARHHASKPLQTGDYDYYLQIDSHTRFSMHYDSFLISTHRHAINFWGPFVWTAYCPNYTIKEDSYVLDDTQLQTSFAILDESFSSKLVGCVKPMQVSSVYGEESFQISGHFLFGEAYVFVETPFDPFLYWEGEESTYAARLYSKNVKTVSPPKVYLWHKYESDQDENPTRKKHSSSEYWTNQEFMNQKIERLHSRGLDRCFKFWNGDIEDPYGVRSKDKLDEFLSLPNRLLPDKYARIGY